MSSQGTDSEQPTKFGPPFDDEDADMLVRSSDEVQFCVFKLLMVKASPVFRSLLSSSNVPPPADGHGIVIPAGISLESSNGLPVVCLPETSQVLATFLSIIMCSALPSHPSIPESLEDIIPILAVAERYQAPRVATYIRSLRPGEAQNPFLAFSLAWRYRLKDEAVAAVRSITSLEVFTIESVGEDLQFLSGPCLYELLRCRETAVEIMDASLREFRGGDLLRNWIRRRFQEESPICATDGDSLPQWLKDFFESVEDNVANATQIQYHYYWQSHRQACRDCRGQSQSAVQNLWMALERDIGHCLLKCHDTLTFDNDPHLPTHPKLTVPPVANADIILRSSDSADFRAHMQVLAMASPVFQTMFQISPSHENLPVINVAEDSNTLSSLIQLIYYPFTFSVPATVDGTMTLFAALQKYGMGSEVDGALEVLRQQLCKQFLPVFMDTQACRAYFLAVRFRLKEETSLAARALLADPLTFESCRDNLYVLPTGAALHDHSRYRARCREAAQAALLAGLSSERESAWFESYEREFEGTMGYYPRSRACISVRDCTDRSPFFGDTGLEMPTWLATHFKSMYDQFGERAFPLSTSMGFAITSSCRKALGNHIDGNPSCAYCATTFIKDGDALWNSLTDLVEQAIQEVAICID
ncbi:hypothetical protein FA95DRAFT_1567115 [Auriscalpium vulgare]|uniref:Uncharacterized protein n=1 Tax=Auriscalpium vulgare TaxID=40419 RepID=A0ACB8R666_9AGAM|nr:hypothetical protein FA95DRAFT_1567115 [Auriscalpium vulgare]